MVKKRLALGILAVFAVVYPTQSQAGFAEGFIQGFANSANKGISERRQREHEKEILQLQLQQKEKELELRRQELELQQQMLQGNRKSDSNLVDVPNALANNYFGRTTTIRSNIYIIEEVSAVIETFSCDKNVLNAKIILDVRDKRDVKMIFIDSNTECKVKNISK